MKVMRVRGVNEALPMGVEYLLNQGVREETRNGWALVSPVPITTVYSNPQERVLLSPVRDANPFFHLAEAVWMLMGRADAKFLNNFVSDFGARFAEDDGNIHGAYGRRWRHHFVNVNHSGEEDDPTPHYIDQLVMVIAELKRNPASRQVVLTMWDPEVDLGVTVKDRPCNTHVYFRIREVPTIRGGDLTSDGLLDMTVLCRSNDIVMGAYGANAVHFSVLQQYVAEMVGVSVGTYYQVSNNFHAYEEDLTRLADRANKLEVPKNVRYTRYLGSDLYREPEMGTTRLVDEPRTFNTEMVSVVGMYENGAWDEAALARMRNPFLTKTLVPMLKAHQNRRAEPSLALSWANQVSAPDWRRAAVEWLQRRAK